MGGKGSNPDSTEVGGSEVGAGEGHRRSTEKGFGEGVVSAGRRRRRRIELGHG